MFARPYAPSDRPAGASPLTSPRKHAQLFRTPVTSSHVPHEPVLGRGAYTTPGRPGSAATAGASPIAATPVRPQSAATQHGPQTPYYTIATPTFSVSSPRGTPSHGGPTRHGRSPSATLRHGNADFQAAFLWAVDARHRTEADRLTLFNRLAHLRSGAEKAARAAELTRAQIDRVEAARVRHALESEARQEVSTAQQEARDRHARTIRTAHTARRDAFSQYKRDMVLLRREQASAQRDVHAELLAHRANMASEELERYRIVRADIQERHRLFHERAAAARMHELAQAAQQKEWRILLEQQRRVLAEEDLVRMQAEEAELIAHAQRTRDEHVQAVEHLASLVLHERTLPTARARYTSIASLQGRASPRKVAKAHAAAAAAGPTTSTAQQLSASSTPTHHHTNDPTQRLELPLPTPGTQQRIHMPRPPPSPRTPHQHQQNVAYSPRAGSNFAPAAQPPSHQHQQHEEEEEKQNASDSYDAAAEGAPTDEFASPLERQEDEDESTERDPLELAHDAVAEEDEEEHSEQTAAEQQDQDATGHDEEEDDPASASLPPARSLSPVAAEVPLEDGDEDARPLADATHH